MTPGNPVELRLYWCGDCERWSSLACHDQEHHQRSFESVVYIPVGHPVEGDFMRVRLLRCGECNGVASKEVWDKAWWAERSRRMAETPDSDYGLDCDVCPRCAYVHSDDESSSVSEVDGQAVIAAPVEGGIGGTYDGAIAAVEAEMTRLIGSEDLEPERRGDETPEHFVARTVVKVMADALGLGLMGYRECGKPDQWSASPCVREENHRGVCQGHTRFVAYPDERVPAPVEGEAREATDAELNERMKQRWDDATEAFEAVFFKDEPQDAIRPLSDALLAFLAVVEREPLVDGDTLICSDCIKSAVPSCDVAGHGLGRLADLVEANANG